MLMPFVILYFVLFCFVFLTCDYAYQYVIWDACAYSQLRYFFPYKDMTTSSKKKLALNTNFLLLNHTGFMLGASLSQSASLVAN